VTAPVPAAPAPRVGFVGWGPASAAVLETLARSHPAVAAGACWFEGLPPHAPGSPPRPIPSVEALFAAADFVFLEASPAEAERLLPLMRLSVSDRHTLVLLHAEWRLEAVLRHLHERKLVRCLVQRFDPPRAAALAYHASPFLDAADVAAFRALFADLELVLELESEAGFDVVQALAGIAPAIYSTVMDALADGALVLGLPRHQAARFLAATLLGAVRGIVDGDTTPGELRERALEGAYSAAGLMEFETSGVRGVLMRVVQRALQGQPPRGRPED